MLQNCIVNESGTAVRMLGGKLDLIDSCQQRWQRKQSQRSTVSKGGPVKNASFFAKPVVEFSQAALQLEDKSLECITGSVLKKIRLDRVDSTTALIKRPRGFESNSVQRFSK